MGVNNLELYEKCRQVPKEAQKEIKAGNIKGFTDINPMWRIKKLTELFGVCGIGWYFEITNQWLERDVNHNEISAFVMINLFIKYENEWSKPIVGIGGNKFINSFSNGLKMNDECYKMALTDALSVACKSLGIGADIYFNADKTKYDVVETKATAKQTKATTKQIEMLKDLCDVSALCKYYKVDKIEDLTAQQASDAIDKKKGN